MKRTLLFTLATVLLATALAPTAAAEAKVFNLTAHAEGAEFYFMDEAGVRNPPLNVSVGDDVIVNVRLVTGVHNFHVGGPIDEKTGYSKEEALRFTVPADAPAVIPYWCDPHMAAMKGVMNVAGGTPVDAEDARKPAPAPAPVLAVIALALTGVLLARRSGP